MFVEKEIRNFTLSNGSLVQIVVDSPFFYVYVDGTRFRTNEQPASYSGSYLSSYLHRNLGLDDRVQVKYKNYYCSLFMPDKKKRVEIEVTPSRENRIYVTARVNNATVYRKMEQKLVRLFCGIQDLEIYRQLRKEYLNCVGQHNFLSFNTEKIASMFDYELVQVFRKSYKILREPSEPYKEYMKNILRLMYEDACKRGFSQPVGQPSNAGVIKHDVDVPDIKVSPVTSDKDVQTSSVASNRDVQVSPVENNRDTKVSSVENNRDTKVSPVANNKDVVSSMLDEKKSDDIDDDTNKDEYSLKRDKKPSFADDRKVISFEEYKRLRANGVKVDYTHYKVEYKSHEEYEERVRLLYEDHMKLNAERHRQELSQAVEQPIDTGVVKHDIDVPDIKASSDEDFGDDYASDEDYGDYSSDGDEDYGDYDSDDEDYGDGYFSDSDDKDYSLEEDVSNDYSNKEDSLDVSDEEKVNDLDDNTEEDVSDDDYSSDDEDYGDYFSDDEDNYGDDDYFSDDEEYGDDYGDSSLDDEEDYGDYDVSEEDSPSDDSDVSSDNDKGEDLGEQCSSDEGGDSSDENDSSNDVDSDLGDEYSSDDSESFEDEYLSDDEDLSDEDSGIEDDYGDYSSDNDEDFGDYDSDDDYDDYSADDEEDYGDGYDSDDEDFGDNY